MRKYKIYFERKGIDPIEITISGEGNNCRVSNVTVKNDNFSFNFQESEENLLKAVSIRLSRYEVKKIEKIS